MTDPLSDLPSGAATTAERVRQAFAEQAARTEPAPDAYARLAERVADAQASRGGRGESASSSWLSPSRRWPSSRLAFAGVVAALVLFGGGYVLTRQPADDVLPEPSANTAVPVPDPNEPGPDEGGGVTESVEEPSEGNPEELPGAEVVEDVPVPAPEPGPELAPVHDTRHEAAVAFLPVLGVETNDVSVTENTATVRAPSGPGGETGEIIATLDLVAVDRDGVQGWTVAEATSIPVMIERLVWANASDPAAGMIVRGRTSIGEPGVVVEVRSAVDGSLLATAPATGSSTDGRTVRYSGTVLAAGTDWAWLVVRAAPGTDGSVVAAPSAAATGGGYATGPLAAVPVRLGDVPDESNYVVVNIRDDDPDGGLNLRAAPGPDTDRIEVLAPGTSVKRLAKFPVGVAGSGPGSGNGGAAPVDVWWEVETPQGAIGWVSIAYLAVNETLTDPDLDTMVRAVLDAAGNPEAEAVSFPVSWRAGFTLVASDGKVTDLAPRRLVSASGWRDPVGDGSSLVDLVAWPAEGAADIQVNINRSLFTTTAAGDLSVTDFASLPHATASYTGTDGQLHHVHVFVERGPAGPAVVGLIIEIGQLPGE